MWYPVKENNGTAWYFTIPVKTLIALYKDKVGENPKSFFDCGCGVGELIRQGEALGLKVKGIDVKQYPTHNEKQQEENIEIVSILDYGKPITYDIVFCNGTLTYLNEETIDIALEKLRMSRLLIAIHNTTEDDKAAGYRLSSTTEPRLIRSQKWWLNKLKNTGFNAEYDTKSGCFIAQSQQHQRD